jgi:hypothetical protein
MPILKYGQPFVIRSGSKRSVIRISSRAKVTQIDQT